MAGQYRTEILAIVEVIDDTTGENSAIFDDFVQINAKFTLNKGGMAVVVVPDGHRMLDFAEKDTLFRIRLIIPGYNSWRPELPDVLSNGYGSNAYVFFHALYRDKQVTFDENGNLYHMLYLFHPFEVFSRYISAYPNNVANKSVWTGQQIAVIITDIINANCSTAATTVNGRIRDAAVVRNLQAVGSATGTPVIDFKIEPGTNIQDVIFELAKIAPINLSINITGTSSLVVHQSQITGGTGADIGRDFSDVMVFHIDRDNIARASIGGDTLNEKTVAVVGGAGEGGSRSFAVVNGPSFAADNDRELWVNASSFSDDELPVQGEKALVRTRAKNRYSVDTSGSLGYIPMRDFRHGDIVTTIVDDEIRVQRVESVEFTFDQSQRIQLFVEMEDFIGEL